MNNTSGRYILHFCHRKKENVNAAKIEDTIKKLNMTTPDPTTNKKLKGNVKAIVQILLTIALPPLKF